MNESYRRNALIIYANIFCRCTKIHNFLLPQLMCMQCITHESCCVCFCKLLFPMSRVQRLQRSDERNRCGPSCLNDDIQYVWLHCVIEKQQGNQKGRDMQLFIPAAGYTDSSEGTASAKSVHHEHRESFEEDNPGLLCLFKLMTLSLVDISHT